mmetsp:Transcript_26791/g.46189  ORF Transcript_26791/g.46189 Transcript_26791/m.46189 type:complete len:108 (-) Transcript_26791:1129-1452(-)
MTKKKDKPPDRSRKTKRTLTEGISTKTLYNQSSLARHRIYNNQQDKQKSKRYIPLRKPLKKELTSYNSCYQNQSQITKVGEPEKKKGQQICLRFIQEACSEIATSLQ